jgi:hypothetical protein
MTIKKLLAYGVWAVCLVITTADARAAVTSFQDRDLGMRLLGDSAEVWDPQRAWTSPDRFRMTEARSCSIQ